MPQGQFDRKKIADRKAKPHVPTRQAVQEMIDMVLSECKRNDIPIAGFFYAVDVSPYLNRYTTKGGNHLPLRSYIKLAHALGYSVVLVKRDGPSPIEVNEDLHKKIKQFKRIKANQRLKRHGKKPKRVDAPAKIVRAKKPKPRILPPSYSRTNIILAARQDENDFLRTD